MIHLTSASAASGVGNHWSGWVFGNSFHLHVVTRQVNNASDVGMIFPKPDTYFVCHGPAVARRLNVPRCDSGLGNS